MSSAGMTSVLVRYQVLFKTLLSPDKPARPSEEPPEMDFLKRDYSHRFLKISSLFTRYESVGAINLHSTVTRQRQRQPHITGDWPPPGHADPLYAGQGLVVGVAAPDDDHVQAAPPVSWHKDTGSPGPGGLETEGMGPVCPSSIPCLTLFSRD